MWQSPSQRTRSAAYGKKRDKSRMRKPFHIKRIVAQLVHGASESSPGITTDVRMVLNDLSVTGAEIFSPVPLNMGEKVTLNIQDPQKLSLSATVTWCQEYAMNSHILSDQPYSFRIGIEYVLKSDEERETLRSFCQDITNNYILSPGSPGG